MGVLIGPVEITWPKGCFYLPPSDGISALGKWDGKIGRLFLWHKQPVFEWSSKMLSPSLTIEPPSLPISHLTCYSKVRPSITLVFSLPSDWDGRVLFSWPPATRRTENQTLDTLSQWNTLTAHSQLEMCYEWMMHLYEWLWKILL